ESIASAFRPVVFIGAGVRLSKACDELSEFIRKTRIPVVTSLMGLDAFPHNNNSFAGMIGTYGNRYANLTVANADLILALGVRFDTRQTGTKPETFARGAKIIHVDIDPSELNNKVRADLPIKSDVKKFLTALNNFKINYPQKHREPWREKIRLYKQRYPSYKPSMDDAINPNFFMHELSMFIPEDAVICVDVGQHQMWAAQSLELKATHRFLTQGGMGAMGSALSMSIGASFAKPKRIIVVITGDGGFQLNIQELQTIHHYQLPIKIILLNNGCYGMVRQFQEQYFHCRFQSTVIGYSCPNFQEVVSAYKISVMRATFTKECAGLFQKLFDNSKPTLLEVSIKQDTQVLPKLSVNKPVEDQDPPMSRGELKSNMFIDIFQEDKKNED
ncbi:MAG: thiamine pyrophosphate-binding protein, partial [Candidatus Omnitrophica bacterium]|nr:thiamine pyrophosphate-binding protein [Candidatus Omnitrophota bacterium]